MLNKVIKSFRLVNDLTVSKVSDLTGISSIYVGELERGIKKNASQDTLSKLAKGFNVSLEFIVGLINYGYIVDSSLDKNDEISIEHKDKILLHLLSYKILDYYIKQNIENGIYSESLINSFNVSGQLKILSISKNN